MVGENSKAAYGVMQFHYNNPANTAGYRDSSGLRLTITTVLPANEMAAIVLFQLPFTLPMGYKRLEIYGNTGCNTLDWDWSRHALAAISVSPMISTSAIYK